MPNKAKPEYDSRAIIEYIKLSPKEKLDRLEALNEFFRAFMPKTSTSNWEKLKRKGW